jgi:hypothetical protein
MIGTRWPMSTLKHEVVSATQVIYGFTIVVLVMLGIGGTIYKVIAPDGWVAQAFGRSLSAGVATLGSLVIIFALAWFSRGYSSPRRRNGFSDLLVYSFAAAGLLYLVKLWIRGTF